MELILEELLQFTTHKLDDFNYIKNNYSNNYKLLIIKYNYNHINEIRLIKISTIDLDSLKHKFFYKINNNQIYNEKFIVYLLENDFNFDKTHTIIEDIKNNLYGTDLVKKINFALTENFQGIFIKNNNLIS